MKQLLLLISINFAALAEPRVIVLKSETIKLENKNCTFDPTCKLKEINFIIQDYKIWVIDRFHYGSSIIAEYETYKLEDLEAFAFAQFIQGCRFSSQIDTNGNITQRIDSVIQSFDQNIPFKFPYFIIDSLDTDPIYNSSPLSDFDTRHAYYRWNTVPNSHDKKSEKLFGYENPTYPKLYIKDLPSQAYVYDSKDAASNLSINFNLCLFNTSQIPTMTHRNDINFALPIYCQPWKSSFIYDFKSETFVTENGIHPACK